tara:strand:- start:13682 stop:14065 length:384 start_codon:yes stop_codon:yes gene_type:complete
MKLRIKKDQRVDMAKKAERAAVTTGVPRLDDLFEGSKSIRLTNDGLFEYIKYKNVLYKLAYIRELDVNAIDKLSTQESITSLTDNTGGSVSNICNDTTSSVKDDMASVIAKIEEILKVLRTHKLIKE